MLSRSAQGLYWMSRYLERSEHACRALATQFEAIEDRPVDEIDQSWRRIYSSLNRMPVGGDLQSNLGDEDFMLTDSFTLADDLTFEASNPASIRNCIESARENARQVRHVIGKQTWSHLNTTYLDIMDVELVGIWHNQPRNFYVETGARIRTLFGTIENTMYRDHGWHFLQLGRFMERVQIMSSLLDMQLLLHPTHETNSESDWHSLLQICEARLAYDRLHSVAYDPAEITSFLISDPLLSHSIRYALSAIKDSLDVASVNRLYSKVMDAGDKVEELIKLVDDDWHNRKPGDQVIHETLNEIRESSRQLHDDIDKAYFNYEASSYTET